MQPGKHPAFSRLSRFLLDPLSLLFKAAACANLMIQSGRQRAFSGMFIISVDGLSFGGSGKTPLVMAIGKALESRGARFAIVSRGYRSRYEKPGVLVDGSHAWRDVGDEPTLLKACFPGQDVIIGRNRLRSIAAAAARGNRIVILDDGFQSAHIRKDFSIMLVNPVHPYFYLRHFRFLARRADRVLVYRPGSGHDRPEAGTYDFAIRAFLDSGGREVEVDKEPLVAFSALGDNERFAADMRRWRLAVFRPFPDHHPYTVNDLLSLEALRKDAGATWMVCTEKDFCKLKGFLVPSPLGKDRVGAQRDGLQGLPLLYTRNEIQLPGDLIEQVVTHAAAKGFI